MAGIQKEKIEKEGIEKEITEEDVTACYRYILGRIPESKEIVKAYYETNHTLDELRAKFLQSSEFKMKNQGGFQITDDYGIKVYNMQGEQTQDVLYWAYRGSAQDMITLAVKENKSFEETAELIKVAETICKNGCRNFLDLGANIGAFSLFFAKARWKCFCAEASDSNIHALSFSAKLNDLDITLIPKIIHEKTGKMYFVQNGPFGFVLNHIYDAEDYEELDAVCLDDLFPDAERDTISEIGFIKMDIEGSEAAALRGGKRFLEKNNYPPIYCEFNKWTLFLQNESAETLSEEFRKLGYRPFHLSGGILSEVVDPENQIEIVDNYLFIHDLSAAAALDQNQPEMKKIHIMDKDYTERYIAYLSDENLTNQEQFIALKEAQKNRVLYENDKLKKLCMDIERELKKNEFFKKIL